MSERTYRVQVSVSLENGGSIIGEGFCDYDDIAKTVGDTVLSWVSQGLCKVTDKYTAWWMVRQESSGVIADFFGSYTAIWHTGAPEAMG